MLAYIEAKQISRRDA